jgi:hypothetical protein
VTESKNDELAQVIEDLTSRGFQVAPQDNGSLIIADNFVDIGEGLRIYRKAVIVKPAGTGWLLQCEFRGQLAFTTLVAAFETAAALVSAMRGGTHANKWFELTDAAR